MTEAELWKNKYLTAKESGNGCSVVEELPNVALSFFRIFDRNLGPFNEYAGIWLFTDDTATAMDFKELPNSLQTFNPEEFLPDDPPVLLLKPGTWKLPRG